MKKLAISILLATAAFGASADTLTFENIPFTQFQANWNGYNLSNTNSFGSNYGNLLWSNNGSAGNQFAIVKATDFNTRTGTTGAAQGNGIVGGLVSGDWVAINGGSSDVWFQKLNASASNFNFTSAYMSAAWYNGLKVDITGYRDGNVVYSTTTGPLGYNASLQTFNWTNLDKVMFHSQNVGTVIDNQSTYNHSFVMDNMTIAAVPEPESYALMLAGLGVMGLFARRRKSK